MNSSFPFTLSGINTNVKKTSIGNYALGHIGKNGSFIVRYVGRSDSNVRNELKNYLDIYDDCKNFKYSYALTIKEAFEKECKNYHDFNGNLYNKYHPDRPDGKKYECPVCDIFDYKS